MSTLAVATPQCMQASQVQQRGRGTLLNGATKFKQSLTGIEKLFLFWVPINT